MNIQSMPLIIAHAGGGAKAPENTLAAFRTGLEDGADGFELDVHLSQDGLPVVVHDFTLERVTGVRAPVSALTANELAGLDAGSWFSPQFSDQYVPTLAEVLALYSGQEITINIEIKAGSRLYPKIEEKCLDVVSKNLRGGQVIFSSFDHYCLLRLKEIDDRVITGALHGCSLVEAYNYASQIGVDALHPQFMVVDQEYMAGCEMKNLLVNTWTVNDIDQTRRMHSLGVHAIITDDPAGIRASLENI